ncbi:MULTISPECIES: L,D-transpeptidase [Kitasatospora]|uniref:L,D-transpeptidase n=1 Tax=Kitasatospora TaxID=2063 RepID=UPI0002F64F76|nr:L,D-transpeptidase [Kitasatospora setae]
MAKLGPGVVVGGLTLGAMAVIGLLAFQANGASSRAVAAVPSASSAAPSASASESGRPPAPPLPAESGAGLRVVYSLQQQQVWLVDPKKPNPVVASFKVVPGNTLPPVGTYSVASRTAAGNGTDGRQIEHVVRFAQQSGTVFGFSALVDEKAPAPSVDPKTKTGGIRASRADGQSLWDFAPNGTRVVVVA